MTMSVGLPSRVFFSDVSSLEFGVSTGGNGRCSWRKCPRGGAWVIREGSFQLDEPRALIRSNGGTARVRGSWLRNLACRRSIAEWRIWEDLRPETVNYFDQKRSCSPDAADCRDCEAGAPLLAVWCHADSSDKGKEEIPWTNESVTTASSALAEWRSSRTRSGQDLVDWGRYHLQVMFVDRSHRARSRLAEGLFERIAAWNGFGLILYGHSCGISVKEGELPSMSYQGEGHRLGVARHVFKAPATTLDRSDLDSYDLIVAMDIEVRDEILRMAGSQPSNGYDYANKVRLISEFVSDDTISLLEDNLLDIIQPDLPQALTALEVQATYMSQYSKWRMMVATITMCCAGLIQFLIDAYPDDLPDYDPVD